MFKIRQTSSFVGEENAALPVQPNQQRFYSFLTTSPFLTTSHRFALSRALYGDQLTSHGSIITIPCNEKTSSVVDSNQKHSTEKENAKICFLPLIEAQEVNLTKCFKYK